jgi:iron complex outermembrane receptor protein
MVNVDLSLRPTLAGREVLLFVRGSNLLDEEARRHTSALKDYAPLAGRAVSAGVRWTF